MSWKLWLDHYAARSQSSKVLLKTPPGRASRSRLKHRPLCLGELESRIALSADVSTIVYNDLHNLLAEQPKQSSVIESGVASSSIHDYGIYQSWGDTFINLGGGGVGIANKPGGSYQPWIVNSQQDIYQRRVTNAGADWIKLPGKARDIDIGFDGTVYIIGNNPVGSGSDYGIYSWNGSTWINAGGGGVRISVGPDGTPWIVNSVQDIYHNVGGSWQQLPGKAFDIDVGIDGIPWIIGTNPLGNGDFGIYSWNGSTWINRGGGGVRIAALSNNTCYIVNSNNDIWRLGSSGAFQYPGKAQDISTNGKDSDSLYISPIFVIGTNGINSPPTVNAGGPYAVNEGEFLSLNAIANDPNDDTLTFAWDLNNDGSFDDETGQNPTIDWLQLVSLGINDGSSAWNIAVRVDDHFGAIVTSTTSLIVRNVAPLPLVSAQSSAVRAESVTFTLTALDPSAVDQAAGFMFEIDWDGNGVFEETVNGLSGLSLAHAFDTSGMKTVKVRATDKDGGVSQLASHLVDVQDWALRVDPQDPLKTDLHWGGTTVADNYVFESIDPNTVQVRDGQTNAILQTLNSVNGRIYAYAGKGNDTLVGSTRGDYLNGGDGNDTIYGDVIAPPQGAVYGSDTVIGGDGDDILYGDGDGGEGAPDVINGDAGNDIIFGDGSLGDATGADTIFGGSGNDTITADPDGGEGAADSVLGEAGDDFIKAGGGNDVVLGGDGDDILLGGDGAEGANDSLDGGDGRDIIVGDGGSETVKSKVGGADTLRGGTGQDIVIAGLGLPSVANPLDFIAIRSEWTSGRTIAERIANITGPGSASRANGNNFLAPGTTVYNDKRATGGTALVDQVLGGADEDWIFSDVLEDVEADLGGSDILVDLSLFSRPE